MTKIQRHNHDWNNKLKLKPCEQINFVFNSLLISAFFSGNVSSAHFLVWEIKLTMKFVPDLLYNSHGLGCQLMDSQFSLHISWWTRTLLVALSLACLEMSFVVKGPGAVILLFRLEYKTSVVCHNVNTQKVKISRRDRPHWVGRCGAAPHTLTLFKTNVADFPTLFKT